MNGVKEGGVAVEDPVPYFPPDWYCCRCNGRNWYGNVNCCHCGGTEVCDDIDCKRCLWAAPTSGPFVKHVMCDDHGCDGYRAGSPRGEGGEG